MSLGIETEVKHQCLFVTVMGQRTRSNIQELTKAVVDRCISNNVVRTLVDLRQFTGRLDISDSFIVVTDVFPSIGIFNKLERVAVLESKERNVRSRFFEGVAHARGYEIRMFDCQEEAAEWISESKQPV